MYLLKDRKANFYQEIIALSIHLVLKLGNHTSARRKILGVTLKNPPKLEKVKYLERIKNFLGNRFPGVNFFFKIILYQGGRSVLVSWTDGPTEKDMQRFVDLHKGASLNKDGVIEPCETILCIPGQKPQTISWGFEFIMLRRYLTIPNDPPVTRK